jgi:hypothetical protein
MRSQSEAFLASRKNTASQTMAGCERRQIRRYLLICSAAIGLHVNGLIRMTDPMVDDGVRVERFAKGTDDQVRKGGDGLLIATET